MTLKSRLLKAIECTDKIEWLRDEYQHVIGHKSYWSEDCLRPLLERLIECAEHLRSAYEHGVFDHTDEKALAALEAELGKMEGNE